MPSQTLPAPTGGWNARDDLANMPLTDAVVMENWVPRPGYVETRLGTSAAIASNAGIADIGTIVTFRSTLGEVLIVSQDDSLWSWDGTDVETFYTGSTGEASFWTSAHFQDKLIMCLGDGTNRAQVITYNGTTVSNVDLNITTGPNEEDIRGVNVFKERAYYWETAAQSFWYAAAGAFQGDLTEFPLDTVLTNGGALQMMVTITRDGGGGQDDLAAFIFSTGEVLLYQGDNPGDASAWELIGKFTIGQPVDPQAHAKVAGTELIWTRDGIVDLSQAISTGRFGDAAEFSNKITDAATTAATDYIANSGWQIVHHPAGNMVLCNVPTSVNQYEQYIRMTDTGAWWKCKGLNGVFSVFNDELHFVYFSTSFIGISKCFTGTTDNHIVSTGRIDTSALPAYASVGRPELRKLLRVVKPFTNYGDNASLKITGRADFDVTVPSAPSTSDSSTASLTSPLISAAASGNYISYFLQTSEKNQQIRWNSSTIIYSIAGPV